MKKQSLRWVLIAIALFVPAVGIWMALSTGETSPIIVEGTIKLSDELADKLSSNEEKVLFLVLYDASGRSAMPYGAMRQLWDPKSREQSFVITPERLQVMAPDRKPPQMFRLKARIDADGQAGMDQPGDLVGEMDSVTPGSTGVSVLIGRKIY